MRTWFWTILVLAAAVGIALLLRGHSGNLLILLDSWRIEVSLTFAVVVLIAAFVLLYVVLRLIAWLTGSPQRYRDWRGNRAGKRDQALIESGWIHSLEGRYELADKDFTRLQGKTRSSTSKVVAMLAASRAAWRLGERQRSLDLLAQAGNTARQDHRLQEAVAVVTAEVYLDDNRPEDALLLLQPLHDATTRYVHVKRLLLRAHQALGNHGEVYEITRWLQARRALSESEASRYLVVSVAARIQAAGSEGFKAIWKPLRPEEKTTPAIAFVAAEVLSQADQHEEAGRILEAAIDSTMDPQLLGAYSQCPPEHVRKRLNRAENWLKTHTDNSALLAALGALCMTAELWGPAERYLQQSMAQRSDMRIHALLGQLYDHLDRPEAAARHWRLAADVAGKLPVVSALRSLPAADTRHDPTLIEVDTEALTREDGTAAAIHDSDGGSLKRAS